MIAERPSAGLLVLLFFVVPLAAPSSKSTPTPTREEVAHDELQRWRVVPCEESEPNGEPRLILTVNRGWCDSNYEYLVRE